jgi:ubiquinone/menaquinone biosynthesis C-methylase UbiE
MLNSVWDNDPVGYAKIRECWLNTRRELYIREYLRNLRDGDVVLEVGSGTGNLLRSLATQFGRLHFVGIEPLQSYVDYSNHEAQKEALRNVSFIVGSGEEVSSLVRHTCRVILSNDVLHHVADQKALARSLAVVSDESTDWLAIEPNCLNLYTFYKQATAPGEQNFFPSRFLAHASEWQVLSKRYLFLIPPFVREPGAFLKKIEEAFEWMPFVAGGVVLHLKRKEP